MSKKNHTLIATLLDKSSSMGNIIDDTLGRFNNFLKENQELGNSEVVFTLALFNNDYHLMYDSIPIQDVPFLDAKNYSVCGTTSLLDAIGKTINSVDQKMSMLAENEKPEKVVFVVITDGMEDSSKEFTKEGVISMINHREKKYSWEFIFLEASFKSIVELIK